MNRLTFLEFDHYRYLKIASLLMVISILVYLFDQPETGAYGGTLLGYFFGILSAIIAVAQVVYGIRKRLTPILAERRKLSGISPTQTDRRTHKTGWGKLQGVPLQGWLSAHVYFGLSLLVLATLHTGFQFGWDIHTFAYVLMVAVIIIGFYGIHAYLRFPRMMTDNMGGMDTLDTLLIKIEDLDKLASIMSLQFSDDICAIVLKSRQKTLIGGNFFRQLTAYQRDCPTASAVRKLHMLGKGLKGDQLKSFNDLYSILVHKDTLVTRARLHVRFKALLEFWQYLHAPLSIAFLTALVAHIIAIFYYW